MEDAFTRAPLDARIETPRHERRAEVGPEVGLGDRLPQVMLVVVSALVRPWDLPPDVNIFATRRPQVSLDESVHVLLLARKLLQSVIIRCQCGVAIFPVGPRVDVAVPVRRLAQLPRH
eukprot:1104422-Prymnesium_polylepis.1